MRGLSNPILVEDAVCNLFIPTQMIRSMSVSAIPRLFFPFKISFFIFLMDLSSDRKRTIHSYQACFTV